MKRILLAGFALSVCLNAAPITQADLQAALESAKAAWGVDIEVSIAFETHPGSCDLPNLAKSPDAALPQVAYERDSITSFTPAVETNDDELPVQPETTVSVLRVITVNSSCKWTSSWLKKVVMHEYGHALGLKGHSQDPHDIMNERIYDDKGARVFGDQKITSQDRASLSLLLATK